MAVYGNTVAFQEAYSNRIDLISWLNEACTSFNDYIDSFLVIKEENDLIVADVPYKEVEDDKSDEKKKETVEKIKKTFWQKVKEIFIKVIDAIKKFFRGIYTRIHEMYMNTNLKDKFWSRWKDKVTYPNLQKAKDNGWQGLHKSVTLPGKIWDPTESKLFSDLYESLNPENDSRDYNPQYILELIDQMMDKKSENEVDDIFKDIEKAIGVQQERLKGYDHSIVYAKGGYFRLSWDNKYYDNGDVNAALATAMMEDDQQYYFPPFNLFANAKKLAEEGQRIQKDKNYDNKINLKAIKDDKEVQKSLIKNDMKAYEDDPLMMKKLNYKMKATLAYVTLYYKRCYATCKSVGQVVAIQYQHSISAYIKFIQAINKYVFKNEGKATAEA